MKIIYTDDDYSAIFGAAPTYYHIHFPQAGGILLWSGDSYQRFSVLRNGETNFRPLRYPRTEPIDTAFARFLADPATFLMELVL